MNIAIIGLGLMGGSFALDVKSVIPDSKIYGIDSSDLNLKEALILIDRIKAKKTYLTHISHNLGFHKEVEKQLPKDVHLSYDGLELFLI